jgi:hypothetical protein
MTDTALADEIAVPPPLTFDTNFSAYAKAWPKNWRGALAALCAGGEYAGRQIIGYVYSPAGGLQLQLDRPDEPYVTVSGTATE